MAEQINDHVHLFGSQDLTRRQFGIIFATVVGGWAAWQVLGPKQANAPQPDPEQQRLIADMMATAQAGEGRAIVGDTTAIPHETLSRLQAATNVIVVRFRGGDVASAGTVWKLAAESGDSETQRFAGVRHVYTDQGRQQIQDIEEVWLGHPFGRGFTVLPAGVLSLRYYGNSDSFAAADAAILEVPAKYLPQPITSARGLSLSSSGGLVPGQRYVVMGVPTIYMPAPTDAGLAVTPLYAATMTAQATTPIEGGVGLKGEVIDGMSGGCVTLLDGSAVGIVDGRLRQDRHATVAIPASALLGLMGDKAGA